MLDKHVLDFTFKRKEQVTPLSVKTMGKEGNDNGDIKIQIDP